MMRTKEWITSSLDKSRHLFSPRKSIHPLFTWLPSRSEEQSVSTKSAKRLYYSGSPTHSLMEVGQVIQEICLVPTYPQLNLIGSSDLDSDLVLWLPLLLFQGWLGTNHFLLLSIKMYFAHFPKSKRMFGVSSNYPGELNGKSIYLFLPQCSVCLSLHVKHW